MPSHLRWTAAHLEALNLSPYAAKPLEESAINLQAEQGLTEQNRVISKEQSIYPDPIKARADVFSKYRTSLIENQVKQNGRQQVPLQNVMATLLLLSSNDSSFRRMIPRSEILARR